MVYTPYYRTRVHVLNILVDLRVFDNPTALVSYYSRGCCVFLHKLQGKVTTAQVDTRTVYQKKYPSTGIPCTGIRFKNVVLKG
jgi:hypothetical protein